MRTNEWFVVLGVALCSCKAQQASVEQRPVGKVSEPPVDTDKDNARAVTPEAAQRVASALARHPEPFLGIRSVGQAPSLRVPVGKAVSFDLGVPGLSRWAEATVARFVVRLPGGVQDTVPVDPSGRALVSYTFPAAGPAMLMFCAGPKGDVPDPTTLVTHCSKIVVAIEGGRATGDGDDFLGETGLPLDVVPLVSPVRLGVGSELPVSFHYMSEEAGGIEVAALRPDGTIDRQTTSRSGVAHFQITQPGRWVVRFAKVEPSGERVGELVFEVAEGRR